MTIWKAVFLGAVLACAADAGVAAAEMEKLKVAISFAGLWTSSQPIFCKDRGEFSKAGLVVDIVATRGGSENVQAVITRAVDIGYGAGLSAVLAAQMQGADIKIIGSGFIGNSDSFFYVPADSPIKTIDDLKGKSIAYSRPGAVSEVLLRDLSTEKHIEFKTVSGGALDAIFTMTMTRQIDVGMAVPPTAVDALRKGEIRIVFDGNAVESQRDVVNRVTIANGDFVKNRRAVGTKFLTVLHDCIDWMYAHQNVAVKMYATLNHIDSDIAARSLAFYPRDKMELSKLTGFHAAVEQAVTDRFIEQKPTDAQLKTFVDVLWTGPGQRGAN
jgi:NitT/TauT family transport system substrate-binding protein